MLPPFDYFQYRSARNFKRNQRTQRFASLPSVYHAPFSAFDQSVIDKPIEELVQDVHKGALSPVDVLRTYGKIAIKAQERCNCITELLIPESEEWAKSGINIQGPLAGIPVSLKDSIQVGGFDTSVGYTRYTRQPAAKDGALVRLLKDAGAVPYAKTALPITLLSFESTNDLWGVCRNPHGTDYTPGGSSGGEASLLAMGGRIGVGSDVAGSVRLPAAWSGCYSLRCSTGRWPKAGVSTSMAGQEGVPSVFSPMARTLNDLTYFARSIIGMEPWKYDTTVHPITWRSDMENDAKTKKLRIGVMRSDGVVPPTPAIARGINTTVAALIAAGHTIVEVKEPSTATSLMGLNLASLLLNSDGCETFNSHLQTGESSDPGAVHLTNFSWFYWPFRYAYYLFVRYIKRDATWAYLLRDFGLKTATQQWKLVAQRETFRATWHDWWNAKEQDFDFILCPVNATPALPHGAMTDAISACGYTFFWNMLDYSAGVIPVGHVDSKKDALVGPDGKKGKNVYKRVLKNLGVDSAVSRGAWKYYDADAMHGLPIAVQVVGRRWHEEKVIGCMHAVEKALEEYKGPGGEGGKYQLLEID
ncbi:putative amidase [Microsporum canis]|uniref:amidase n=1 Tax=Arthroderma otae (strain ATCC MYA-4605 / CBS 113480) TaxID=554155 RepID=C5FSM2_ARTOC|nr:acetamidase [Microsporum canis CBS 113480]EEQ32875.1 acetamidase [Microsporum canis CBS 113480]